ncbi:hypothetical protein BDD12DRAFT_900405 [Trichophaea hybrida]|nr:hypothetical protein BDD12DRAFT_900405 [Trichophaea hybrida]
MKSDIRLSDWHSTHESETAVTAKALAVADTEKMDEETDEETDDIRNTGAPIANQIVIQLKNAEKGSAPRFRAKTTSPEVQNIYPERKEMMNEHVINADSLNPRRISQHRNNHDGYQAPYETPYDMLNAFGKVLQATLDESGNKMSYKTPLTTIGMSEVIFDEDRNTHVSCLQGNENDIFELPQETEYVEELDNGDGFLHDHIADNTSGTGEGRGSGAHGQNNQAGGDGFLHGRIADNTSGTGESYGSGAHGCTDEISDALQRRWLPTNSGSRTNTSHAPDEEAENIAHSRRLRREDQTAQRSAAEAENIAHSRHLCRKDQTARRSAAIKKSSQVPPASLAPPIASRVTRIQAMESPQRDHWKRAMEEESTSIDPAQ